MSGFMLASLSLAAQSVNTNCYNCHYDIDDHTRDFGGIIFPHGIHLGKAKLDCLNCHQHTESQHGMILIEKNDCKTCHHAQKDAQCSECHSLEVNMYTGNTTIVNIKIFPNIMAAKRVTCKGCHTDLSQSSDINKIKDACVGCHRNPKYYDKNFRDLVDIWEQNTVDGLKELDKLCSPIAKHKWKTPEQEKLFKEAQIIINFLKQDKSKGAHNMEFADILIIQAKKRLVQLNQEIPQAKKN